MSEIKYTEQDLIFMQEMDAANEQIEQEEKTLVIEKWTKESNGKITHKIIT